MIISINIDNILMIFIHPDNIHRSHISHIYIQRIIRPSVKRAAGVSRELAKMSIDPKFVELTADVFNFILKKKNQEKWLVFRPRLELAKMSIDPKFAELTADVF